MPLLDAAMRMATMPLRLSVAATQTTLALGTTPEAIQPRLRELAATVPELHASVDALNRAVGPLSGLATRLPGGRRRTALEA